MPASAVKWLVNFRKTRIFTTHRWPAKKMFIDKVNYTQRVGNSKKNKKNKGIKFRESLPATFKANLHVKKF